MTSEPDPMVDEEPLRDICCPAQYLYMFPHPAGDGHDDTGEQDNG